jgi:signal transduction histidine kinase/ligand-binding sensor domain-containing protein
VLLPVVWAVVVHAAFAERLPLTFHNTASGLPHDRVKCIARDSRGFQWFCTPAGLGRFDGERFVVYGVDQGLSHPSINHLLEARDGTYWVATNGGGVCGFRPGVRPSPRMTPSGQETTPSQLFDCLMVGDGMENRVNILLEDRSGRLWAGTDRGLFRLDRQSEKPRFTRAFPTSRYNVWAIVEDAAGDVWAGGNDGLTRIAPDGGVRAYAVGEGGQGATVWSLLADREGRLWIGHETGLVVVRPLPATSSEPRASLWNRLLIRTEDRPCCEPLILPTQAGEARRVTAADGFVLQRPGTLVQTSDGHVWIGSGVWSRGTAGVLEFDGQMLRAYSPRQGLSSDPVIAIGEDRDRHLWLGTMTSGAMRLARAGATAFGEADGLTRGEIHSIVRDRTGEFYAVSAGPWIHHFDGERFTRVRPNVGSAESAGWYQAPLVDHLGEWWIPTRHGLYRFPAVPRIERLAQVNPVAAYGMRQGLPGDHVLGPYEDRHGDVWFGTDSRDELVRWERATGRFHVYGAADGIAALGPALAFREDRTGDLWIGFRGGAVARRRQERFEIFRQSDGVPRGEISVLHLDRAGRLWVGSRDALTDVAPVPSPAAAGPTSDRELARVDEPTAARPQFSLYPEALLSGLGVRAIVEDPAGMLYIGGDRGVLRLDQTSGKTQRYSLADGLPSADVETGHLDRNGALWFGTWRGIARMIPAASSPTPPSATVITRLGVRGVRYPVAELGETEIAGLQLASQENQLEIEFLSIAFDGAPVRYQYRLEGVDADWGPPVDERRVAYVSLSPGEYRFVVRASTGDGVTTEPAAISFVILAPWWQRAWFLALVALTLVLVALSLHRARVSRLLAVERMRTRIATDLHDDIGASLSQIAVLSEVIRQQAPGDRELGDRLERVAATSRELVASMSDIVWAISPSRDSLRDLVQRMRRFASDVLTASGVPFTFHAPDHMDELRLDADLRRHVYLIFKEAVNNLARHARAGKATIDLSVGDGRLTVRITDDGVGFDAAEAESGTGLTSLRARAAAIGATIDVASAPGRGTSVLLELPLGGRTRRLRRSAAAT